MLRIGLLGAESLEYDGVPLTPPAGRPARALLGWLALHPGLHPRGDLASRLWPDVLDTSARASLRSAAWALRGALGPAADVLEGERERLGLLADAVWVDVLEVERLVAAGHPEEAVALAEGGELLAGLDDDWVLVARDAHRDRVGEALAALGDTATRGGDPAAAVTWARRLTAHDPLGEESHRRLMRALASAGDPPAALEAHRRFCDRLRRELGVAPSAATRELAEDLRAGDGPAAPAPLTVSVPRGLAGRELELAHLRAAWGHAAAGAGRVAMLEGEPGIGKTRLAREVLDEARAAGARVASAAPPEVGDAPLALWAELLHDLCADVGPAPGAASWVGDLATLSPSVAHCLAAGDTAPQPPSPDPQLVRSRLLDAIAETVAWACADRPVALLLDDMHLADPASVEALARVARRVPRLSLLMVITRRELPRRPELDAVMHALASRHGAGDTMTLAPLGDAAVADIARAAGIEDPDAVARVVAAADGNALLATASARALARGEREPPATLRGAVRADAAHLAPEARRLADLLAIAGRDLTAPEIDALALADRDDALRAGVEAGLLRGSEGRVGFRHTLLRDAMAHDLPTDRRASLHEQLAAALARVDQQRPAPARSAEIAHHLRAAGRDADAVGQLRNAAAQARALGAMPETLAFLSEAVQLAPSRAALRLEYAAALAWLGREEAASEQFDRALRDIPPGDAAGKAAAWVARGNWYRSSLCVPHRALPAFRQALGEIDIAREDVPREIRIQALAGAAWAEALIGDVAQVDALIAEIREIAGPHCDDDEVVHEIGHARSTVLIRLGRFAESYAPAEESAEAALRVGRLDMAYGALGNAACAAACAGDLERALRFADRIERAARDSAPPVHAEVLATRAILLARMGRHDEARAEIAREEELVRELGDPIMQATAAFDHGIVALAAGDHAAAADLFDRALRGGAKCSRASARLARAEALTHLERCDEAEAEVRATALEPVGPADQPDTLVPRMARLQGLIAAQRGDRDLAERRLREAVDGWRRVAGDRDGERYAALLMDVGRLPLGGMVMPAQELERAEHDLEALDAVVR